MNRLDIRGLTKEFHSIKRTITALRTIDLIIEPREFFVLLGPSGCGKSTLLNLIAGLEKPTAGEIRFGERIFCSVPRSRFLTPRERNVAMVFQNYALYPHLSVYHNIAFPLKTAGRKKREFDQPVRSAARTLGLERFLDAKPGELSGGQRQRVAIARAIVREPNLFLLDEPLSNLDAQLRASTRAELKRLQRSLGVTAVYVTHDQVEAMTLGDRVAVLREGRIEQIGAPEELYDHPVNTFVGSFVGSPPMNILPAEIENLDRERPAVRVGAYVFEAPPDFGRQAARAALSPKAGIRPEHVRLTGEDSRPALSLETVTVEKLGRETLVYAAAGDITVSLLTDQPPPAPGETVRVRFPRDKVHLFFE
jgi:ABC-type sugar transport system ATPase subunit